MLVGFDTTSRDTRTTAGLGLTTSGRDTSAGVTITTVHDQFRRMVTFSPPMTVVIDAPQT